MSFPLLGHFYQRLLFVLPFAAKTFDYKAPEQWHLNFPTCLGLRQSPIAINSEKSISIGIPPLFFGLYDVPFDSLLLLHNNGHTVEFDVPVTEYGEKPFITGGLLIPNVYEAESVHFHWGSPRRKGSEHILNGRRYDLEMHIVHRNTKYPSLEIAREFRDGLAVIAVLFKVSRQSESIYTPGLSEIYNSLPHLRNFNSTYSPPNIITLGELLANINRERFYTYSGSLTTPPCSEAVTWQLFPEVLPISHLDLPKFWQLRTETGQTLLNNFRPLQSSEYRQVYYRQQQSSEWHNSYKLVN